MSVALSIVLPVFNEAEVLPTLHGRLTQVMEALATPYEIVFVNDGSTDESAMLLLDNPGGRSACRVVTLSRNFGHQVAITAGLDHASGAAVVVMDADLQDPPEVIPRLVDEWRAGYDLVLTIRERRKGERLFKRATAALFYRLMRLLTATDIPLDAGDFRLMSRRAVKAMARIRERNLFIRGLVGVGSGSARRPSGMSGMPGMPARPSIRSAGWRNSP